MRHDVGMLGDRYPDSLAPGAARLWRPALTALLAAVAMAAGLAPPAAVDSLPALVHVSAAPQLKESWVRVVDPSRATVSHGRVVSHSRNLPTLVIRPAAPGPHPLVVFSHGYDITPKPYLHLLRHWAAAGFVVAAPYFPLTRSDASAPLDENDVANQPKDVSAVLTQVERVLGNAIDRRHVVIAGHSDGGATSFGSGFATAVRDARWSAVMVFSGDRRRDLGSFGAPGRALPMLLIQSNRDEYNSLAAASKVWAVPRAPKTYVHLYGAKHLAPFAGACAYRDIVEATTTDFLRAWTTTDLRKRHVALHQLVRDAQRRGLSGVTDVR